MNILWIEDNINKVEEILKVKGIIPAENNQKVNENLFEEDLKQPLELRVFKNKENKFSVPGSFSQIEKELHKLLISYDFFIIDVNLFEYDDKIDAFILKRFEELYRIKEEINKENDKEIFKIEPKVEAKKKFFETGGFIIYSILIEKGVPSQNIIFITENANNPDDSYFRVRKNLLSADILPPKDHLKKSETTIELIEEWIKTLNIQNNEKQNKNNPKESKSIDYYEYLRFRRFVIEECELIFDQIKELQKRLYELEANVKNNGSNQLVADNLVNEIKNFTKDKNGDFKFNIYTNGIYKLEQGLMKLSRPDERKKKVYQLLRKQKKWIGDITEYFEKLQIILPFNIDPGEESRVFKYFLRELTLPFDKTDLAEFNYDFYQAIAKVLRNWLAHDMVAGEIKVEDLKFLFCMVFTAISSKLPQDVDFLNTTRKNKNYNQGLEEQSVKHYIELLKQVMSSNLKINTSFSYLEMLQALINIDKVEVKYFYKAYLNKLLNLSIITANSNKPISPKTNYRKNGWFYNIPLEIIKNPNKKPNNNQNPIEEKLQDYAITQLNLEI